MFSISGAWSKDNLVKQKLVPCKPYTLIIELNHSVNHLIQSVDVSERDTFRIVTTLDGVKWTIRGTIGRCEGDIVPVELTIQYFYDEENNSTMTAPFKLQLGTENKAGIATMRGFSVNPSIKKNADR